MSGHRPQGAGAVMAGHAPAEVAADDALTALYRQLDYFPTPPWAGRAGAELIRQFDPEARSVWEPACGEGHMAEALGEYFDVNTASDVHPFGYGSCIDFLNEGGWASSLGAVVHADWIVSNPPFRTAPDFIRLGLQRARRGVAMLVRLAFLEGRGRYGLFYGAEPLTACAVFAERVPMTLGRWDPAAASATAYAWLLWRKGGASGLPAGLGGNPRLMGIPPGTKARLTRPDDAGRFGCRAEAGLLDAMEAAE